LPCRRKDFGGVRAIAGVSTTVGKGDGFAIIGPTALDNRQRRKRWLN